MVRLLFAVLAPLEPHQLELRAKMSPTLGFLPGCQSRKMFHDKDNSRVTMPGIEELLHLEAFV